MSVESGGAVRRMMRSLRRAVGGGSGAAAPEPEHHFIRDYRRLVSSLLSSHSKDEAMALAVGGGYEHVGQVECALLSHLGLADSMSLIDFGCGSGRLAHALGRSPLRVDYLGIDVDDRLLAYAAARSPGHFRFIVNRELSIPAPDASADILCAFSVFTHLKHSETYLYMADMHRILRSGGRLVFSFLEFGHPQHWQIFADTVEAERRRALPHLNQFIERGVIDLWCARLGFEREAFIDADANPWGEPGALGQSIAVLRRP